MVSSRESESQEPTNPGSVAASFVPLFSNAHPRVYACILTLVPNRTDANEIMQEVSLVLWSKFDQFESNEDPQSEFIRWACGIAYNQARRHIRQRQRDGLFFDDKLIDQIVQTREECTDLFEDRREALDHCLKKLKPADRELILLCYSSQGTLKQTAEKLGRPVNTVYKALNRIRSVLCRCIDRTLRHGGDA